MHKLQRSNLQKSIYQTGVLQKDITTLQKTKVAEKTKIRGNVGRRFSSLDDLRKATNITISEFTSEWYQSVF